MKKILCLLSAIAFTFTSCSKDDDSSNSASSIFPKKVVTLYSNGDSETQDIIYNGNKIVNITYNDGSIIKYTYVGDYITKEQEIDAGVVGYTTEYIYNNGKLISRIEKETDAEYYYKTKYTNNVDGTISYDEFRGTTSTGAEIEYGATGKYTYKDGNLIKHERSFYGNDYTYVYEYDTKNNPRKNVLGFNLLLQDEDSSINNVVKVTTTSGSGSNIRTSVENNTYKYDANNYPTEQVKSYISGISTVTETTQFVY